jgi:hypothetical protein
MTFLKITRYGRVPDGRIHWLPIHRPLAAFPIRMLGKGTPETFLSETNQPSVSQWILGPPLDLTEFHSCPDSYSEQMVFAAWRESRPWIPARLTP